MDVARGRLDDDLVTLDEVEQVEAAAGVFCDDPVEVETVDRVKELGQAAEVELGPAIARPHRARLLDQVADDRVAAARGVEVGERVLDVDGAQPAVEASPQPVVEPQRVEVRRRADLEHDVPGAARVHRPRRDQVETVPLRVVRLHVTLGSKPRPFSAARASRSNAATSASPRRPRNTFAPGVASIT